MGREWKEGVQFFYILQYNPTDIQVRILWSSNFRLSSNLEILVTVSTALARRHRKLNNSEHKTTQNEKCTSGNHILGISKV